MKKFFVIVSISLVVTGFSLPTMAVEVAPRITDREIVERLTRLEEGQKAINQRLDDLRNETRAGSEALRGLMLWGFGVLFAGMFALIGFVLWDRRSALKPVREDLYDLEKNKVDRLIEVLREISADDPKVSKVLRTFGFL